MYVTRKPTPFPKEMKPQWQRQVASTFKHHTQIFVLPVLD
jgi:hypothetical protein